MTYRTIDVNGKTYEYVIGKSHTKIKGVGVFLNEHVGHLIDRTDIGEDPAIGVTPADIRIKIAESLK